MRRPGFCIWFVFILLAGTARANHHSDSLKALLATGISDTLRVQVLNELAEENRYAVQEAILSYASTALELTPSASFSSSKEALKILSGDLN